MPKLGKLQFGSRWSLFARDERGASAVEFVLVVPMIIAAYIFTLSFSIGAIVAVKTDSAARSVSDIFASQTSFTEEDFKGVLNLINIRLAPYVPDGATYKISAINASGSGEGTYVWSRDSKNPALNQKGQKYANDKRIIGKGFYILTEVSVPYRMLGPWLLEKDGMLPSMNLKGNQIVATTSETAPVCSVCK
ncbi:pilus assembly protein [Rhizobium sp. CFBP 8762]|uniref:TadE/TadG family type IV pilus assembly protein n=1 Tax=Rhizobium sp. CFBP 8762 TaxID=2775279 RepID=UPI0017870F68|nr:TadE/TadG family type IV pilus assembly protein [Rhizobium sp. CFBP 8762]MBD8555346.1 pilus assembly protein [Rhizobium sp. CFBP 8762]